MTGWRETFAVWLPLAVIGGTFAAVQFLWSNFVGFELVDIVAAVASTAAGVIAIHLWKPRETWRFEQDAELPDADGRRKRDRTADPDGSTARVDLTAGRVARAWLPYGLLIITVLLWGLPPSSLWARRPSRNGWTPELSWKPGMPSLHLHGRQG